MFKGKDLTGQRFGRLVVTKLSHTIKRAGHVWECRCDCGKVTTARAHYLLSGRMVSCGCYQRESAANKLYKHGLSRHPLRHVLEHMIGRCHNPEDPQYKNYGGRGISVCERWRSSIANFVEDMGECPAGHSIERIDNDGDYCPENCRWATPTEQALNTRRNHILDLNGRKQTVSQWAKELNMSPNTIYGRLHRGWSVEKTLTHPIDPRPRHLK